jgi:hypothetical protein
VYDFVACRRRLTLFQNGCCVADNGVDIEIGGACVIGRSVSYVVSDR